MEDTSVYKITFDVLTFRELRKTEKIIGMAHGVDGRYYNLIENSRGRKYMIPTCSYKQFKAINKATK